MKWIRSWAIRLMGFLRRDQRDQDFAEEAQTHLEMQIEENIRRGMAPEEARRQALIASGGIEQARENYRDRASIPFFETFAQDLRFAFRQLRKNPGFAIGAILVLTIGIGVSGAIFAFVDAALIKPLPYRDPQRLVFVTESVNLMPTANLSWPDYLDWKSRNQVFQSLEIWNSRHYLVSTPHGPEPARAMRVSAGFFRTLGIKPKLGRDFYDGEDRLEAPNTVILSYSAWQERFGGNPDVIHQTVALSGAVYDIVGVLPEDFQFAAADGPSDFWVPFHATGECDKRRSCHGLEGIARLKDGVSVQAARANIESIAAQLEQQYPDSNRGQGGYVSSLTEHIVGDIRPLLLTLLGGSLLLLLIACVNVSALLVVRSENRRREIAVRGALGASRARLLRQFVTEALALVLVGEVLGLATAEIGIRLLTHLVSKDMLDSMPYLHGLGLNLHLLAFAVAVGLCAATLFSIAPVLNFSGATGLRDNIAQGAHTSSGRLWRRLGSKLVVAELAIAVVLLAGGGLLAKSFYRLLHVDLGMDPDHLATVGIVIPIDVYPKDPDVVAVHKRILDRVSVLPGVESAGVTTRMPVTSNGNTTWFRIAGRPYHGEHNEANERSVSTDFLKTLKASIIRGRSFTEADTENSPHVAIINERLASVYFAGEDPIGKIIGNTDLSPKSQAQIIGVVRDFKEGALDSEVWPAIYSPFNQEPDNYINLVVRTSQAEESILPTLVSAIHEIDPRMATYEVATMSTRITESPVAYLHRSSASLVGAFAGVALLLGVFGLYSVIAYSVSQRTREIGVRMALGAQPASVYQLILKEAGSLTGTGVAMGILLAMFAAASIRKLLFGVSYWDISTMAAVVVVLSAASLLASYIPARRAASVNPVEALRSE